VVTLALAPRFQFLGFVVAGGLATVVNYGIYLFLMGNDAPYLLAASVGYVSGIVVSFSLNRLVVYRSTAAMGSQFARYVGAYLLALGVQLALLEVLVRVGLDPLWGNAFAITVVVVMNFFVVRRFVFTPQR
jgi:putative flippase GtrA